MKPSKKILILIMTSVALVSCSPNIASEQAPQMTSTPAKATRTPTQPAPTQNSTSTAAPTPGPLPTAIPNDFGLTIEENEMVGDLQLDPMSFNPVHGSQDAILERHEDEKENIYQHNNYIEIDENNTLEAITYFAAKDDGVVMLQQNGETIFEADVGDGSPIDPFHGLWVEDGHWILEVAYVTSVKQDNTVHLEIIGQVYRNGVNLNDLYGYEEIFGYQHLDDKPFYFYKLDGKIHLSYDGKDLPIWYDKVWHYGCCSIGVLNPKAASNWIGFWGIRDGVWYYTEIGQY